MVREPFAKTEVKIAVIGGGTGSFTILSGLKKYTSQLAAIVGMADDGGSTGVLRDELGALPPGDIRKCLVALSDSPKVRSLFDYRFEKGTFKGHSFGNILLTALEKITGDFSEAVETASDILRVRGVVIPATLDNVRLKMEWPEAGASLVLHGERVIDSEFFKKDPRKAELSLIPKATANPTAIAAIEEADIVVIAPGDLYSSLGSLLIIDGIRDALKRTTATKIYVSNLVSKQGQTDGFSVSSHAKEIERFAGGSFLDYVIYNDQKPPRNILQKYKEEGGKLTRVDKKALAAAKYKAIGCNLIGEMVERNKFDLITNRSLIRHDSDAIARQILKVHKNERK